MGNNVVCYCGILNKKPQPTSARQKTVLKAVPSVFALGVQPEQLLVFWGRYGCLGCVCLRINAYSFSLQDAELADKGVGKRSGFDFGFWIKR